jgi:hypothetical protein
MYIKKKSNPNKRENWQCTNSVLAKVFQISIKIVFACLDVAKIVYFLT